MTTVGREILEHRTTQKRAVTLWIFCCDYVENEQETARELCQTTLRTAVLRTPSTPSTQVMSTEISETRKPAQLAFFLKWLTRRVLRLTTLSVKFSGLRCPQRKRETVCQRCLTQFHSRFVCCAISGEPKKSASRFLKLSSPYLMIRMRSMARVQETGIAVRDMRGKEDADSMPARVVAASPSTTFHDRGELRYVDGFGLSHTVAVDLRTLNVHPEFRSLPRVLAAVPSAAPAAGCCRQTRCYAHRRTGDISVARRFLPAML